MSSELELRRQLEEIDWCEKFFNSKKSSTDPVEFLKCWKNHTKLRSSISQHNFYEASFIQSIKGDCDIDGSIQVK